MKFDLNEAEIKYIKISFTDIKGIKLTSRASIKRMSNREIIACGKFQENCYITTPQKVSVNFVYSNGIYKSNSILKTVENEEPYMFFILETPQEVFFEQNREFFRINTSCNCICRQKDQFEFNTKSIDISANGISILTENTEKIPDEIIIFINNTPISTKLQHIRTEEYNDKYKMSFTFLNINEKDQNLISQTCIQKQLEQRRNSIK